MPKAYASAVLPATADEVWAVIRDFAAIADWLPALEGGELEEGDGGVGSVRKLTGPGGTTFRERMVALDDTERSLTYEIDEGPFPVRGYRATTRVAPITETGQAFVEWYAWFSADAKDEDPMTEIFTKGVFTAGLAALRERFA